jgi:hypothetical protein
MVSASTERAEVGSLLSMGTVGDVSDIPTGADFTAVGTPQDLVGVCGVDRFPITKLGRGRVSDMGRERACPRSPQRMQQAGGDDDLPLLD